MKCAFCGAPENITRLCPKWAQMEPRQIWDLAQAIPQVAREWRTHVTDSMRVLEIWVRDGVHPMPESGPNYHIAGGVASVSGPHDRYGGGKEWIWKVGGAARGAETKEAAMAAADEELKYAGYLLCQGVSDAL